MKKTPWMLAGLCLVSGLCVQQARAAGRLQAKIVDDATGKPLAARVAVTNPDGRFIEIEGQHAHVQYLEKRWCYVDGSFNLAIPDSGVSIEIRRGLETRPLSLTLGGKAGSAPIERTLRLRRWIDMRKKGWFNGDIHAHLPVPKEAYPQMQAEDLNALTLLHNADKEYKLPTNECFTGKLDVCSTPDCEIYVGQEICEFQIGHLNLVNATRLVPGYPDMGGGLEYWRITPHWDLTRAVQGARDQKAMVVWAHMCSLPGEELPVRVALGQVDAIELITWSDPTQLPNHWLPWEGSGMSQAEFPVMRSMDLYYQFLNAGFRMPIAAGTDKFGEEIPLGSNRVYAQVRDKAGHAAWLEAIKAGRDFVTNGPILEFNADANGSGDVVSFQGTRRVKAKATARSILPFTTLEIVANGQTVGHKTLPVDKNPARDGVYSMEITVNVDLDRSTWLAARVADHPDLRSRILPRGLSVFAHTSPVYFLKDGTKVREQASIAYLTKYVQGVLHWLGTKPQFAIEEDRTTATQATEEALKVYKGL